MSGKGEGGGRNERLLPGRGRTGLAWAWTQASRQQPASVAAASPSWGAGTAFLHCGRKEEKAEKCAGLGG